MIRKLTKISTSPMLLKSETAKTASREDDEDDDVPLADAEVVNMLPENAGPSDVEVSGKPASYQPPYVCLHNR